MMTTPISMNGTRVRRLFALLMGVLVLLVLSGCSTRFLGGQDPEEQLRERVEARWEAVLAMNFDKVYEFATPAYREVHGLRHFHNQYGGQVRRTGFEIRSIDYDASKPDEARVRVTVFFESVVGGQLYEGQQPTTETWVRRDGQWWYVEPS